MIGLNFSIAVFFVYKGASIYTNCITFGISKKNFHIFQINFLDSQAVWYFPYCWSQYTSILFLILPFFMLTKIPWQYHLSISIEFFQVVISRVLDKTQQQLHGSISCLWILRRVLPSGTFAFSTLRSHSSLCPQITLL